jgi:hypothetical protein
LVLMASSPPWAPRGQPGARTWADELRAFEGLLAPADARGRFGHTWYHGPKMLIAGQQLARPSPSLGAGRAGRWPTAPTSAPPQGTPHQPARAARQAAD